MIRKGERESSRMMVRLVSQLLAHIIKQSPCSPLDRRGAE
jgi:hypothetical protein